MAIFAATMGGSIRGGFAVIAAPKIFNMKKYLCLYQYDSRMGASPGVTIVKEKELKEFSLYAEYIEVYELAGKGKPLSKKKKKKLGMSFSSDKTS